MNTLAELYAQRGRVMRPPSISATRRGPSTIVSTVRKGILSGRGYSNRCEYLNSLGRHAEALVSCRKALAIWEAALGRDHAWLGYVLTATGIALTELRRPGEALAPLRRAVDLRKRLEIERRRAR